MRDCSKLGYGVLNQNEHRAKKLQSVNFSVFKIREEVQIKSIPNQAIPSVKFGKVKSV